jgi:integrase
MSEYSVQRFRGGFAVVYHDAEGRRRRERLAATDRAGAEAEARQRWRLGDQSKKSVGNIVTAYHDDREANGTVSVQRMRDAWKAMRPFWDSVTPELIDEEMCKAYAAERRAADATVRYELSHLAVALRWAAGKQVIERAPTIWRPAPPERQERHLTRRQFKKLLSGTIAPHARLYMLLGIFTAARPSALLDLTWDRVDFERGTVNLNPPGRQQTAKRRPVVALNGQAIDALRLAYAARQSAYVIERGAKKVGNIKKAFQAASERSGVHATPYTLRHTAAVWMAEAGTPMAQIAQFMGHDDSATTERHYARFSPGFLRGAANALMLDTTEGSE